MQKKIRKPNCFLFSNEIELIDKEKYHISNERLS